jgi:hypothetical protein
MLIPEFDSLLIGFDFHRDEDEACLVVIRKASDGKCYVIKSFLGEEAKSVYKTLTSDVVPFEEAVEAVRKRGGLDDIN